MPVFFPLKIYRQRVRAQTVARVEFNTSFCKSSYRFWDISVLGNWLINFMSHVISVTLFHIWLCFFVWLGVDFSGVN